jgi:hypothetical protein
LVRQPACSCAWSAARPMFLSLYSVLYPVLLPRKLLSTPDSIVVMSHDQIAFSFFSRFLLMAMSMCWRTTLIDVLTHWLAVSAPFSIWIWRHLSSCRNYGPNSSTGG